MFFGNHSSMPQSLSKVIIHIIFSSKDREPWLGPDVPPRMHAYVATICRDLNAEALRVGGGPGIQRRPYRGRDAAVLTVVDGEDSGVEGGPPGGDPAKPVDQRKPGG